MGAPEKIVLLSRLPPSIPPALCFTDTPDGLQGRPCHDIWVPPATPDPLFTVQVRSVRPHPEVIKLARSPMKSAFLSVSSLWARKGRTVSMVEALQPVQRKIPREVKILPSWPSKGFPLWPGRHARFYRLASPPPGVSGVACSLQPGEVSTEEVGLGCGEDFLCARRQKGESPWEGLHSAVRTKSKCPVPERDRRGFLRVERWQTCH